MTVKLNISEIKRLSAVRKVSNTELSERSGISRQSISTILRRGTCTAVNAGRLADALKVDAGTIMKEG